MSCILLFPSRWELLSVPVIFGDAGKKLWLMDELFLLQKELVGLFERLGKGQTHNGWEGSFVCVGLQHWLTFIYLFFILQTSYLATMESPWSVSRVHARDKYPVCHRESGVLFLKARWISDFPSYEHFS